MRFFHYLFPRRSARRKLSSSHLTIEALESLDLLSTFQLGSLVQASGPSPFVGNDADHIASQPGTVALNSEGEPYVAVNPANPNNVVAVWQQDLWSNGGGRGIVDGVSFDDGATWRQVVIPGITLVSGGPYQRAGDNWLSFAPNGDLYEIALAGNCTAANGHLVIKENAVLVSKSADGGLTWGDPVAVIQDENSVRFDDKDTITVDPTNSNFVYAVWERINNFQNGVQGVTKFARSADGGRTWEAPRDIFSSPNNDTNTGHEILVRPDGTLIDLFTEITTHGNGTALQLMALRSTDKGLTWSTPISVARQLPVATTDPDNGHSVEAAIFAHYAVDPTSGNVYGVWADGRFSNFQYNSIVFSMSTDGGFTWSAPIRINQTTDNIPVADRQAFLPSVVVAQDGTVAVTYYDFRNNTSAPGVPTDYWIVHADPHDGLTNLASWQEENRLTNTSFNFEQAAIRFGVNFVGDYEGSAADGNSFFPVWAQPNGSDADSIFFRPIIASSPLTSEAVGRVASGAALADNQTLLPFKGQGSGAFTDANGDFFATGIATHLGAFTHYGTLVLTPTDNPFVVAVSGRTVYKAANGDLLYAVTNGTLNVLTGVVTGTDTWDGGTGRFTDANGVVEISARLLPSGSVIFDLLGTIAF
jgi:hypothetical protein